MCLHSSPPCRALCAPSQPSPFDSTAEPFLPRVFASKEAGRHPAPEASSPHSNAAYQGLAARSTAVPRTTSSSGCASEVRGRRGALALQLQACGRASNSSCSGSPCSSPSFCLLNPSTWTLYLACPNCPPGHSWGNIFAVLSLTAIAAGQLLAAAELPIIYHSCWLLGGCCSRCWSIKANTCRAGGEKSHKLAWSGNACKPTRAHAQQRLWTCGRRVGWRQVGQGVPARGVAGMGSTDGCGNGGTITLHQPPHKQHDLHSTTPTAGKCSSATCLSPTCCQGSAWDCGSPAQCTAPTRHMQLRHLPACHLPVPTCAGCTRGPPRGQQTAAETRRLPVGRTLPEPAARQAPRPAAVHACLKCGEAGQQESLTTRREQAGRETGGHTRYGRECHPCKPCHAPAVRPRPTQACLHICTQACLHICTHACIRKPTSMGHRGSSSPFAMSRGRGASRGSDSGASYSSSKPAGWQGGKEAAAVGW